MQTTENHDIRQPTENPTSPDSPYLGLGVVVAVFGLIFFFNHQSSLSERVVATMVWLLMAATMALPAFLWWRFYSRGGPFEPLSRACNVFTFQLAAAALLVGGAKLMTGGAKEARLSDAEQMRMAAFIGCAMDSQVYMGGDPTVMQNWRYVPPARQAQSHDTGGRP